MACFSHLHSHEKLAMWKSWARKFLGQFFVKINLTNTRFFQKAGQCCFVLNLREPWKKNFPVSSRKLFAPISLIFQFIARRNFVLSFKVYCFPLDYFDFSMLDKLETLFSNKDRNNLFIYLYFVWWSIL